MRAYVVGSILMPLALAAQGVPRVSLSADTTVIKIGEQVQLLFTLEHGANAQSVQWPAVGDTLSAHIEVIKDSGPDTVPADGGFIRAVRTITITSFDSGFWAIPPLPFIVDGEQMNTDPLLLEVRTVPVDSTHTVRPIKDIITLPFSPWYWIRSHAYWIAGGVAILLALVFGISYFRRERPAPMVQQAPANIQPLHERVLAALLSLDKERIWQQGDHKKYYSRLTDLLRSYVEERYRVPAMESTTDELLRELRVSPLNKDQRTQLENMLKLADQVKFAKAQPSPQENEQMMIAANRFVKETAQNAEHNGPVAK